MSLAHLFLIAAFTAAAAPTPRAKPYWLKTYSLAPHWETWTGELSVKSLDSALPKVVAAVEKNGGRLTQPLEIFAGSRSAGVQQMSLKISKNNAPALLQALRRLGKSDEPAVRLNGVPIPLDEVHEKLSRLTKDKTAGAAALAQAPAAAEAVDEIIEHLANVEAVSRATDAGVLWNLTVRERR